MSTSTFVKRSLAVATLAVALTGVAAACGPAKPKIAVADVTVAEGAGRATVSVTLSAPARQAVTSRWNTLAGTATPADYTQGAGTLTIPAGSTRVTVAVPVTADALDEDDEQLRVGLYSVSGATAGDLDGTVTIPDDDAPPAVSIGPVSPPVVESDGTTMAVRLQLSAPSGKSVSVRVRSGDGSNDSFSGTATAPADYQAIDVVATFPVGADSKTVWATVVDDALDEGKGSNLGADYDHESFTASISEPVNASLGGASTPVRIHDNDAPPTLSVLDARTLVEADADLDFTVQLSAPSGRNVDFRWETADVTAEAGSDYVGGSTPVRLAPGQTSVTVPVRVLEDDCRELSEVLDLGLVALTGNPLIDSQAQGRIIDDGDDEPC